MSGGGYLICVWNAKDQTSPVVSICDAAIHYLTNNSTFNLPSSKYIIVNNK